MNSERDARRISFFRHAMQEQEKYPYTALTLAWKNLLVLSEFSLLE